MVELIGAFAGNVERGEVKSDSKKIMPPIAVKNAAAKENRNAKPLLIAKKVEVPPKKTQPPFKGRPIIKEKVAEFQKPRIFQPTIPVKLSKLEMKPLPKPEIVKLKVPVEKIPPKVLTKKVQKAKPIPKPEIAKPKVPVEKTKPPVLNQKFPKVTPIPKPEFVRPKLLTVTPKEISKPRPLPKPLKREPTKSVAVEELDKLAKLTPSIKKPPIADNSITEQTFEELDALKFNKSGFKFDKAKVIPPLNLDNPLEGFDSMKMKKALKTASLRISQPPSETEPALLENLEFESLAKRSVDLENPNKEKDAGEILAESEQRKKLKEILKRKLLTDLSGNRDPVFNKEPAIVQPKYRHIDIEVVAEIDSTAFKSGIRDLSTSLPEGKKDAAKFAKLDAGQSQTSVKSNTGKPNADILSRYVGVIREKVMSNWKSPLGAEHNQVLVTFYLYSGGNVGEPIIEKSSGNSQLDALALRAIANSAPFPKFPSEFKHPNLHISIHFKYIYLQE
ncbi:MAG: TonB family protein [Nitrospinae bacterium]|nr:TonB family protein [Nitrospinota bacterium]